MCRCLKLPIYPLLKKNVDAKQSDLSAAERREIAKYISLDHPEKIRGKKVLIVDDVYTTGSTAKACLKQALKAKPKKIIFLAMSKVKKK